MKALLVDGTKTCTKCGETKPFSDFQAHPKGKYGLQSWCRTCKSKRASERRHENPEGSREANRRHLAKLTPEERSARARRANYRQNYGITIEEYEALLESQGGVCAICREECRLGRRLSVDHDHETGAVRGLLCSPCNTSLGGFRDSEDLMVKAIVYLRSHR